MAITVTQFISASFVKNYTVMNENVDPKVIEPYIVLAQDLYLHPALGTDLFNAMKVHIAANVDSGTAIPEPYKTLQEQYILPMLPWFVMYEAMLPLTMRLRNKGVQTQDSDNSQPVVLQDLQIIRNEYKDKGEWYRQRMIDYLCDKSNSFPEYTSNNDADDIKPIGNSYESPIYLGTFRPKCPVDRETKA